MNQSIKTTLTAAALMLATTAVAAGHALAASAMRADVPEATNNLAGSVPWIEQAIQHLMLGYVEATQEHDADATIYYLEDTQSSMDRAWDCVTGGIGCQAPPEVSARWRAALATCRDAAARARE